MAHYLYSDFSPALSGGKKSIPCPCCRTHGGDRTGNNLSITEGQNGKANVKCWAGCLDGCLQGNYRNWLDFVAGSLGISPSGSSADNKDWRSTPRRPPQVPRREMRAPTRKSIEYSDVERTVDVDWQKTLGAAVGSSIPPEQPAAHVHGADSVPALFPPPADRSKGAGWQDRWIAHHQTNPSEEHLKLSSHWDWIKAAMSAYGEQMGEIEQTRSREINGH